ncbi:MAG TPA: hypothetical protein VFI68_06025 [Anaerolineales bacterium]|nr:hypothetical protein [Anaerolineales bacterium]
MKTTVYKSFNLMDNVMLVAALALVFAMEYLALIHFFSIGWNGLLASVSWNG